MSGFLHYFLSALDPMSNLGFSRAIPELMTSELPSFWLTIGLSFILVQLPAIVTVLVYFVKPAWIQPPLLARPGEVQPLVSVVIAGRNESATIGQCIRGALLCGYPNLEVIFVDDNSEDDSVAIARRAALSATGNRRDAERVRIFPSPRRNGKASSLNIGIRMARGEYIAITDADSVIQYGIMQHWLQPFADPRVGAVAANIRVNNSAVNLLTRLQELEYALKFTLARFIQARLDILSGFRSHGSVACMSEVIGAFLRAECGHDGANPARKTRDGSFGCLSQLRLEFAEGLFDRVEVRRVFRKITQFGSSRLNHRAHAGYLVDRKAVHHHDIAALKCRHKTFFEIG